MVQSGPERKVKFLGVIMTLSVRLQFPTFDRTSDVRHAE